MYDVFKIVWLAFKEIAILKFSVTALFVCIEGTVPSRKYAQLHRKKMLRHEILHVNENLTATFQVRDTTSLPIYNTSGSLCSRKNT